jgi:MarR family transcriptional regulator, transcriptional regulator for hemolysin
MATSRAIRRAYDKRLGSLALNLTEASALAYVAEHGSIAQTRLAQRLGMGRASMGATVDALYGRGLLTRAPDPADRRVWLVGVSAEGRRLADATEKIDRLLREDLRKGLSRQERQQLSSTLLRLKSNLDRVLEE